MEQEKEFNLNIHSNRLLIAEPFFAAISRHVEKISCHDIATAGIRVNSRGFFELYYNPTFMGSLPDRHKSGVLKHEFYHLLLEHVQERLPEEGMNKKWNVAADLAINSHLQGELPESACMPGVGIFEDYPLGFTAERYYEMVKKDCEEAKGEGGDNSIFEAEPFDDHSGWGEGESAEGEDAIVKSKQRLKKMMEEAAREAQTKHWGSIPEDMRRTIKVVF